MSDICLEAAVLRLIHDVESQKMDSFDYPKSVMVVVFDSNNWQQDNQHANIFRSLGLMSVHYMDVGRCHEFVQWAMPDFVYARLKQLGVGISLCDTIDGRSYEAEHGLPKLWWLHDKVFAAMRANPLLSPYCYAWCYGTTTSNSSSTSYTITIGSGGSTSYGFTVAYPAGVPKSPKAWECDVGVGSVDIDSGEGE